MRERITMWWKERPLTVIIILALFFRLLAVLFSKGYGMHDDHFLVIESAQSWVDGYDYNDWLPTASVPSPSGHSFTYCGLHYFFFKALHAIGLTDPQGKMYLVRLLHALLSLTVVYFGYRITEKLANKKTAGIAGLLLAMYFFMPVLSVRNLVEVACIPFLIWPTWLVIKKAEQMKAVHWLLAGLSLGFAFDIRFQCILFAGGFGLALLIQKKWAGAFLTGLGFLISAAGVQGLTDFIIWGKPFVEFSEYVRYNLESSADYFTREWYMYFTFLAGVLIPPVSLFLLFGFFRDWKKHLLLFLPAFVFLAFHSWFPNKQERFILPIVPFIIVAGIMGWNEFASNSSFWQKRKKLLRACWVFFWILNTIPLLVVSAAYTKRSRVEAMSWIRAQGNATGFVVETGDTDEQVMMPKYYLGKWVREYYVNRNMRPEDLAGLLSRADSNEQPNYVIFVGAEDREKRVACMKAAFPALRYEATIDPSFIDALLHWLNPAGNQNETSYIYSLK